jgi:hypothetical protein
MINLRTVAKKYNKKYVGFKVLAVVIGEARFFEMLVTFYQTTRRYNTEDSHPHEICYLNQNIVIVQSIKMNPTLESLSSGIN